jgi:hypothetical protein
MSEPTEANWQDPSLHALAGLTLEAMPAFEVLFLDELAGYLMGAGPLEPPYTVEHGSRVVSVLFGSALNAGHFTPERVPAETPGILLARETVVQGAHAFAGKGVDGLAQLVNRIIPAVLGELEIHKEDPAEQTRSLYYYALLAIASGPLNMMDEAAANGVMEAFGAWDGLFGDGLVLPWRRQVTA